MKFSKFMSVSLVLGLLLMTVGSAHAEGKPLKYAGVALMAASAGYMMYIHELTDPGKKRFAGRELALGTVFTTGFFMLLIGSKKAQAVEGKKMGISPFINPFQKLYGLAVNVRY